MKIAVVAATEQELAYLKNHTFNTPHSLIFLTHRVGMLQACLGLYQIALTKPDLIIQVGIAGAYSQQLNIGDTVIVESECLGDSGAEDHEHLLDLFDLTFVKKNEFPFVNGLLMNPEVTQTKSWKAVKGITVNLSAGHELTIQRRIEKFNPDIETMEGACLHYICLMEKIRFIQFRSISNRVEPRDKTKWNIAKAIKNCHHEVIKYIHQLP